MQAPSQHDSFILYQLIYLNLTKTQTLSALARETQAAEPQTARPTDTVSSNVHTSFHEHPIHFLT